MKRRSGGGGNKLKVQVFSSCLEIQDRGNGMSKQACMGRKCEKVEDADDEEQEVEDDVESSLVSPDSKEETIIDVGSDEDEPEHAGGEELENVIVIDDEEDQPVDERYATSSRLHERALEYLGHPDKAFEECVGIQDERLTLFEDGMNGYEEALPQFKVTNYTVYDKEGHIAPFDTGIIEKGTLIFFSGYLKHLTCEDSSIEDGVPVFDCGPIYAWSNAGFDGGEKALTIFSTGFAEYYLMEPSEAYQPLATQVEEKVFLTKHVIEYLTRMRDVELRPDSEYEDLLDHLATVVPPEGIARPDQILLHHADFVVNQVFSYDEVGDDDEDEQKLVHMPAMKSIAALAGVEPGVRKELVIKKKPKQMPKWSPACVTPLVRSTFEAIFAEQMATEKAAEEDGEGKGGKKRSERCGLCDQCIRVDCGVCKHCKNMTKFGGNGMSKQACMGRKCEKVEDADEEELEVEDDVEESLMSPDSKKKKDKKGSKKVHKDVEWKGEGVKKGGMTYYSGAILEGEIEVMQGDTVLISPSEPSTPLYVATVGKLFEGRDGPTVHVQWFCRGTDTMLGETGDPTQLFRIDQCEDQPLLSVWKKCKVTSRPEPVQSEWRELGGQDPGEEEKDDGVNFWCDLWHDQETRFEYKPAPPPAPEGCNPVTWCGMCGVVAAREEREMPMVGEPTVEGANTYKSLMWKGNGLKLGEGVFLTPGSAKFRGQGKESAVDTVTQYCNILDDPEEFPEFYRKRDYVVGNNAETPDPFQVALVKEIKKEGNEVKLRVQLCYRPEDTHLGPKAAEESNYNKLFWTEEEATVPFDAVRGRCVVKFFDLATDPAVIERWGEGGPYRFFFQQWYNADDKQFEEPPPSAQRIGQQGKDGKGGKGKGKSSAPKKEEQEEDPKEEILVGVVGADYPPVTKRLACLDIFSGCGGLSQGLHMAGVADTKWAVENFEPAAQAFQLNNPDCTVFIDDCNRLLTNAINGVKTNDRGQVIPLRGQVDLLCGGPPCQGFSGMNRFNHREYSQFKNSLVSTYLSYCDFYRPRFFILENVRNFASYKKSMILKACIRALVKMGYQCTFGILQAGQYGVAQTRRRAILLAAAPGEVLPHYPEPQHVFAPQDCNLSVEMEGKRYNTNTMWRLEGPYRTTTVRDTLSDLPRIESGASILEMSYEGEAISHFQRKIRKGSNVLRDHITKPVSALVEARFRLIPIFPGSDWRDLPNEVMALKDGTTTKKLVYRYNDYKLGKSSTGALRGVCRCAESEKAKCDPADKQQNTLIPWCLPHTGNRHNQWKGLYGRVENDGFFSTTTTNPEPMGKQGRVLHPEQHRLVSVRECARSQGFPDTYKLCGTVLEKHRQIGNAVPPPLGRALGLSIREAASTPKPN